MSDISKIANLYFDGTDVSTGVLTSLTLRGPEGRMFRVVGRGSVEPVGSAQGITFAGSRFFRWIGSEDDLCDGLLVMLDVTRSGPPRGGAHQFVSLNSDTPERVGFRSTSHAFDVSAHGAVPRAAQLLPYTDRQIFVAEVDYRGQAARIISSDGWINEAAAPTATSLNLKRIDIGNGVNGTIHRAAVMLRKPGEDYPVTLRGLWEQAGGATLPVFDETARIYWEFLGQSLANGADTTPEERAAMALENRPGNLAPFGFRRTDGKTIGYQGAGLTTLDKARPAEGIGPASLVAAAPPAFSAAIALDRIYRQKGVGAPCATISFGSPVSGQEIVRFDDVPKAVPLDVTAPDITFSWDNASYMLDEVMRIEAEAGRSPAAMVLDFSQGTADRRSTASDYTAKISYLWTIKKALYASKGVTRSPLMLLMQSGGMTDTTPVTDIWEVVVAQIDFAARNADVLFVGPEHQFLVGPEAHGFPQVHPMLPESRLSGELRAWAYVEHEMGNGWEILPLAPTFIGNQAILPFTLREDETLVREAGRFDAYGGCANGGFETTGGAITDVSASADGKAVVITADAPIAQVKLAMQMADMKTFRDAQNRGYSAFRTEWRTTLERDSVILTGRKLQRFLPSYLWTA